MTHCYVVTYSQNDRNITTTIQAPTIAHAIKLFLTRMPLNTPSFSIERGRI